MHQLKLLSATSSVIFHGQEIRQVLKPDQKPLSLETTHTQYINGQSTPNGTDRFTLKINKMLGKGGFGKVFGAEVDGFGRVALKTGDSNKMRFEASLLRLAQGSEAIVQLLFFLDQFHDVKDPGSCVIGLQLSSIGNLSQFQPRLNQTTMPLLIQQTLMGLDHLHGKNIIHRDIKGENVLVFGDPSSPQFKICDLGCGIKHTQPLYTTDGSPLFLEGHRQGTFPNMPPETIIAALTHKKSDVWAWGLMLVKLLTGRNPFGGETSSIAQRLKQTIGLPGTADLSYLKRLNLELYVRNGGDEKMKEFNSAQVNRLMETSEKSSMPEPPQEPERKARLKRLMHMVRRKTSPTHSSSDFSSEALTPSPETFSQSILTTSESERFFPSDEDKHTLRTLLTYSVCYIGTRKTPKELLHSAHFTNALSLFNSTSAT